ncbi:hypothetical protein Micbo1qcDRAFT_38874 [Microdochium bolleyi]|uniref:Uncharacterized protein n=1 Tax=Microdochium bolleyi TaxID=196109 RepID=A0A136J9B4_9PEZI|nr:hypothetical protein Micbo1qcDRAFT_38874 [Microdochium bolleyi]
MTNAQKGRLPKVHSSILRCCLQPALCSIGAVSCLKEDRHRAYYCRVPSSGYVEYWVDAVFANQAGSAALLTSAAFTRPFPRSSRHAALVSGHLAVVRIETFT